MGIVAADADGAVHMSPLRDAVGAITAVHMAPLRACLLAMGLLVVSPGRTTCRWVVYGMTWSNVPVVGAKAVINSVTYQSPDYLQYYHIRYIQLQIRLQRITWRVFFCGATAVTLSARAQMTIIFRFLSAGMYRLYPVASTNTKD